MKTFSKIILYFLGILIVSSSDAQVKDMSYYISNAPFKMEITTPNFANNTFSIKDYGAVADGKTLNTEAFKKAIDACSDAGGGRVVVPAGTWLTGSIELKSNVDLHLEKNALVQFTSDHTQYPIIKAGKSSSSYTPASPIYGYDVKNIAITGQGIFDGAGDSWRPVKKSKVSADVWNSLSKSGVVSDDGKIWWPSAEAMNGENYMQHLKNKSDAIPEDYLPARDYLRPYMLYLVHCDNIYLEGVAFRNSPKFVFYPNHCTNLTMNNVTILNDWWAQNGDGIDISACKNVMIYKCIVSVGDDGICMKSSTNSKDTSVQLQNIIIAGCTVLRAHGGFVIGSNTDGGMQNIYVADCQFNGSDIGVRVKSNIGRGGVVRDIYIDNIAMSNIPNEAILFSTSYEDVPAGKSAKGVKEGGSDKIPEFTNFHFSNITCTKATTAISITGLPDKPANNIYFDNVNITAGEGFSALDARDIFLNNVELNCNEPLYTTKRCKNIVVDGKKID